MYTLDQLKNKVIWVFREPRSGSSWFIASLSEYLQRPLYMFHDSSEIQQQPKVSNSILHTHDFAMLESINGYENPIIFRNARKNKTEQFLSRHIAIVLHFDFAKNFNFNVTSSEECSDLPILNPWAIPEKEILTYIKEQRKIEHAWDIHTTKYENEVVYYEDLLHGWKSSIIPFTFSMEQEIKGNTIKMPYNKKEIITNYDTIDSMLKDEFGDY